TVPAPPSLSAPSLHDALPILLELSPPTVCIQAGGLGYEIDVPMSTLYKLPSTGQSVTLHTHLAIREDAHVLYGFATPAERVAFRSEEHTSELQSRENLVCRLL